MSDIAKVVPGRGPHFCDLPYELQDDPDADPGILTSYLALRRYADWGGIRGARASHATLARKAHVSPKTLARNLEWLRAKGWVEWASGKANGTPNTYTVHRSLLPGGTPQVTDPPTPSVTDRGTPQVTDNQEPVYQEPDTKKLLPATSAGDSPSSNENGVSRETWLTPYFDAWHDRFGKDAAFPAGQIAKALKDIHHRVGPAEVCRRFAHYLRVTKAEYLNVPKFAATFGDWDPANEPMSSLGIPEEAWSDVQRR